MMIDWDSIGPITRRRNARIFQHFCVSPRAFAREAVYRNTVLRTVPGAPEVADASRNPYGPEARVTTTFLNQAVSSPDMATKLPPV
jgi:hypothetical protein